MQPSMFNVRVPIDTAGGNDVFLMKIAASRTATSDRADAVALWSLCTFPSPQAAVDRFYEAYPHEEFDPFLVDYVSEIDLHGLRHTMITELLQAGIDPRTVMERDKSFVGGHDDERCTRRYGPVSDAAAADVCGRRLEAKLSCAVRQSVDQPPGPVGPTAERRLAARRRGRACRPPHDFARNASSIDHAASGWCRADRR